MENKKRDYQEFTVKLSRKDKDTIQEMIKKGVIPVRVMKRCLILKLLDEKKSVPEVGKILGLNPSSPRNIGKKYNQNGLNAALFDKIRPPKPLLLDASQEAKIIAMICSNPPPGRERWSVRLATEEIMRRGIIEKIGRETVRLTLQKNDLKPWRKKNVVHW